MRLILTAAVLCQTCVWGQVFESKKAPADILISADHTAKFWHEATPMKISKDFFGVEVPNHATTIRSRWTPQYLYLLYECPYDELNLRPNPLTTAETNQLWNWDVAEAFIGSDFEDINRYKEFQVSPQGEWVDLDIDRSEQKRGKGVSWNSEFEVKARIDPATKMWYGEMKIPFKTITSKIPQAGYEMRVGLFRIAGKDPERKYISWQQTGSKSFHVPEKFGTMRLVD